MLALRPNPDPDPGLELVGVPLEESGLTLDMGEIMKNQELMDKYDIPSEHLRLFQNFADDFGHTIENFLEIQRELALRMGIPLKEMVPFYKAGPQVQRLGERDPTAARRYHQPHPSLNGRLQALLSLASPSKPWKPLPPSRVQGKTILEGVRSKRRLVFTEEQVYWECCGRVLNETLDLHPGIIQAEPRVPMPNYMLSGIFEGDMHRVPELQYGFQPRKRQERGQSVRKLDGNISAHTSRKLTNSGDSLNAFLEVAAHYSDESGLSLLLGIPRLGGAAAYVRLADFRLDVLRKADSRCGFSTALTSEQWVSSIDKIWSAEMMLHDADGIEATLADGSRAGVVHGRSEHEVAADDLEAPRAAAHVPHALGERGVVAPADGEEREDTPLGAHDRGGACRRPQDRGLGDGARLREHGPPLSGAASLAS
ncbi:hypothetical protein DL767_000487 [Monosporascus sp. MG133]|nr:hypothetical protein DL767_000487 [Monosporascus sp. MG133]